MTDAEQRRRRRERESRDSGCQEERDVKAPGGGSEQQGRGDEDKGGRE